MNDDGKSGERLLPSQDNPQAPKVDGTMMPNDPNAFPGKASSKPQRMSGRGKRS